MQSQILAILASILAIAIGLWKYFTGKEAQRQKRKEEAAKEINRGIDEKDSSAITSGFDRLNK